MIIKQPKSAIIYYGPSKIDGAPIAAIAVYTGSNSKTGRVLQTYIIRRDMSPLHASRTGADYSICGACPHRGESDGRNVAGRSCYVTLIHGPRAVYQRLTDPRGEGYVFADKRTNDHAEFRRALGRGRIVRLGTYGDPAAVPAYVWRDLIAESAAHTGYSHQLESTALDRRHRRAIGQLCMASADSAQSAARLQAKGYRTFRVSINALRAKGEALCPASVEAGKKMQCAQCRACDGLRTARKGNIVIRAHGAGAKNFA